ncbi:ParB-like chromosome segregation protein Spo0J [Nonomuraea thailandensis]|uniref:ParB-like chromosome segregation protein Spo0J n=1 Tax=Nonomuraea thailandensis TaxID=1188745 RepID=A0A9X2GCG2_9ACTN|nr:ParB/RepB/Spo0J family partition protein [Nonomuraea thailandensis]MCP2356376.1 ParB-like chromosome segregation protein Spo0J [Nonomuraea thailandensis]
MNEFGVVPVPESAGIGSAGLTALPDGLGPQIVCVPIATLMPGESPRLAGQDQEHVARLAEIDGPLPAILVRRSDRRVIDGMHRLLAALVRGQKDIDVEFFDGTTEDAFLHAVQANIAHGLPLTHADRRAAAIRIVASHPHMSDRAIARASGLGAKAVAAIRRRSTDSVPQLNARIGRDGRVRPLSGASGRLRAAEVIARNPDASLREVARLAGISPATASDVRKRMLSNEPPTMILPVTGTAEGAAEGAAGPVPDAAMPDQIGRRRAEQATTAQLPQPEPSLVLDKLLRDPSLRLKEEGRQLLRLLKETAMAMESWSELIAAVPPHWEHVVVRLARQYAATWHQFAQELDERDPSLPWKAVGQ